MITVQGYWKFRTLLLVVSVLLAAVLWWGWRRLSRQGLRSNIQMDGAYCQAAENGDVLIRPHTIRDFTVLAWVGAGLACGMNLEFWFYNPWGQLYSKSHGGTHDWPGEINAIKMIRDFFTQHPFVSTPSP